MPLTHDRAIDLAVAEIRRIADVCRGVDPALPVSTCPGWDLAELLRHVGTIHRWAATMVEQGSTARLRREEMDWDTPDDPAALADWVAAGAEVVEAGFRGTDPDRPMWAWGWPKTTGFWPRRMVHETGVHRADAELALGRPAGFDPEAAADGVDELLDNIPQATYFAPHVANLRGTGELVAFRTPDTSWTITLQPDDYGWFRDDVPDADAVLAAPSAGDLLLTLYGRRAPAPGEITGDAALVERWLANSTL
jgi:uncharacterized protein (TIGR03083 family)